MKKMILLLMLLTSPFLLLQAQETTIENVKTVNFYGVDFSKAKIFGAKETPEQLKTGISQISQLMLSEANKYDIEKYLKKQVRYYPIKSVNENNERIEAYNLIADTETHELADEDIREIIASLNIDKPVGAGLVVIGVMLNKPENKGTFQWVFFDEGTREIIYKKEVSGKAGGFGIRNFWAGSIMKIMKKWKY